MSEVATGEEKRVSNGSEAFIRAWMKQVKSDGCITAVAEELGIAPSSAYQRQRKENEALLAAGQPVLPKLKMNKTRKNRKDVTALGSLISELS